MPTANECKQKISETKATAQNRWSHERKRNQPLIILCWLLLLGFSLMVSCGHYFYCLVLVVTSSIFSIFSLTVVIIFHSSFYSFLLYLLEERFWDLFSFLSLPSVSLVYNSFLFHSFSLFFIVMRR